MTRMANYRTSSRRRMLVAILAAGALSVPLTATAAPWEPDPRGKEEDPGAEVQPVAVALPEPTGRNQLGTTELHLVDPTRKDPAAPGGKRELMVSLWYPAKSGAGEPVAKYMPAKTAAAVDAPWSNRFGLPAGTFDFANTNTHAQVGPPLKRGRHPVVLFSPGYASSRFLNTAQVEELASQGYLVVTIDYTYETPVEFPDGRFVPGATGETDAAAYEQAIATRAIDTTFVLNQVGRLAAGGNPDAERRKLPAGLKGGIDLGKVGMFGFSAGGFTTAATMLADARVKAGVNLDGMLQYDREDGPLSEVAKNGLDRPFVLFGMDTGRRLETGSPDIYDKSWASFWQAQRGWKLNLALPGSRHLGFSDYQVIFPQVLGKALGNDPEVPGTIHELVGKVEPERSVLVQRTYLEAFFDQFVRGRPQSLLREESAKYPEVKFVR